MPCGPLWRVGRARMSNFFRNQDLHHRREDAVIVGGVISIGARTGRAVVAVNIVASIATIIIVSTVVGVARAFPREPEEANFF
eukprot:6087121-Pyramimonas_sp.AAC.1